MKAMVLEEFGTDLVLRDVPRPVPAPGEVLVRVVVSGVNPLDTKIRSGAAAHARVTPPMILGIDLSGVIAEVGPGVAGFAVGDEVYGMTGGVGDRPGSLAEYAAVDADLLARKPARLSMAEAAALPLAVITAWEGLVDRANTRDGHLVLVHGGAGGVGHVAVQLTLLPLLTGQGRAHHGEILAQAAALAEAGLLTPMVDPAPYSLETVADAHRVVESGQSGGKIVVQVGTAER